jgi:tRNA dimethylallyltransferase
VGKTGLSLTLAERFGAHLVNADSLQVYRGLDIGTAKPTADEQARAPHHLIDVVEPDQDFDAAAYLRLARPLIRDLDRSGLPVVVVGGTGLYLRSLLQGLFEGPGCDPVIRAGLKEEARTLGREALHARLAGVDPAAAGRLHPRDLFRVVRALEVFEATGRPISELQAEHGLQENPYETLFYCLNLDREILYQRIEERAREMFGSGLVEEVAGLLDRGYSAQLKPFQSIGYKQVVQHLAGRLTREEARSETVKETRRLAKRQLTWYRAQPGLRWVSPQSVAEVVAEAAGFWIC